LGIFLREPLTSEKRENVKSVFPKMEGLTQCGTRLSRSTFVVSRHTIGKGGMEFVEADGKSKVMICEGDIISKKG
jgi:hypothetical protein